MALFLVAKTAVRMSSRPGGLDIDLGLELEPAFVRPTETGRTSFRRRVAKRRPIGRDVEGSVVPLCFRWQHIVGFRVAGGLRIAPLNPNG